MAVTLGSKPVGSIVKLKEDGVLQNYIVVHQGKPSSIYDESCNGTWLLRQKCLDVKKKWTEQNYGDNYSYSNSEIYHYLIGFSVKFEAEILNNIKTVKIPYREGNNYGTDYTGASGLSCKFFVLSAKEVGAVNPEYQRYPNDGVNLPYFSSDSRRKAYSDVSDSTAVTWGLRSTDASAANGVSIIYIDGSIIVYPYDTETYVRPACIMNSSTLVNSDGSIGNTAPSTPSNISFSNLVSINNTITVSWSTSIDEQGDTVKYQLERSTNNGSSWTKIYDGTSLSYTDTVSASWNTVQYRVRAYDNNNLYSAYKTSENKTVLRLSIANITVPSMAMQKQQIHISWSNATNADSYTLERNANNSTWESIYTGNNTSYTDTAGTWNTVQYRVKASNNGSFGNYKTLK